MIEGIILIDVWKTNKLDVNQWYSIVVDNIYKMCNNPYFVNACYNNCWNYVDNGSGIPDLSQYNLLRLYHKLDNQGEAEIFKKSINSDVPYRVMSTFKGLNRTSEYFTDLFTKHNSIFLTHYRDFDYHCTHFLNNKIQNWLVVGKSWQMCLHTRDLGLNNLFKINNGTTRSFYLDRNCVLDTYNQPITEQHLERDYLDWHRVSQDLWRLKNK